MRKNDIDEKSKRKYTVKRSKKLYAKARATGCEATGEKGERCTEEIFGICS